VKLKDSASLFCFSWEPPIWGLPHMNKGTSQWEEEHSLYPYVCRLSTETRVHQTTNMLSIKNTSMLMTENVLVESEYLFFLQNKICSFLAQSICIYVGNSFFWIKHSWTNFPYLSFSLVVKRVEKSNVLMLLQEERGLYCMYSNRYLVVLQNPHLIHTTPWVASVTVTLKLGFIVPSI
jgi:hypothetical protein